MTVRVDIDGAVCYSGALKLSAKLASIKRRHILDQLLLLYTKTFAKWESYGATNSQFNHPEDITIDLSGNVFVDYTGNNRVQVFSPAFSR